MNTSERVIVIGSGFGVLETDEYYNGIINVRVGGSDKLKQALLEHHIQAKHSNT